MKSQEKLKSSYEKQLKLFDEARQKKILNLKKRKEEISLRIQSLQSQLAETETLLEKEASRSFRTFEDYSKTAKQQSEQKRNQTS